MKHLFIIAFTLLFFYANSNNREKKPNIVFILIDDMGWTDVGFMGSKYYETPNIDKLAKNGMIFTQAYANAANCAPTRASLLSGQYNPRHGVFTVANADRGKSKDRRLVPIVNNETLPLDKITIAEALKPAGYVSAAIGKWHVGNTPQQQGFDVGMERYDLGYKNGHFKDNGEYLTDRLTNEAVKFITENKTKPFFLYLAHHAVHTPIQAKNEITKKYEEKESETCHNQAEYAAMIESVDESVSRINQTLEELNLSENTLLIFFSDNGGHGTYTCQKPLRGGKGMYYEGGIREPMFAFWPGKIKAGTTCETPIISTDFYPTFIELAGIKKPENYILDGESIVPLLNGNQGLKREAIFWHFPGYLEAYSGLTEDSRDPIFRSRPVSVIRKGDWKLLQFHEEWVLDGGKEKISTNNSVELYNIKNDIGETKNLCNVEVRKRDELLDQLLKWQKETGAKIPTVANNEFIRQAVPNR
jgi:arylsulfatase A-like enzyme